MPDSDAHEEPITVEPHDDAIVIRLPKGAGMVALTPEAALESADRIATVAHRVLSDRIYNR